MNSASLTIAYQNLYFLFSHAIVKGLILLVAYILIKRLVVYIYGIIPTPSGIHYVSHRRQSLQMTTSHNPFFFEAFYDTASYSGIKCVLKCDHLCYVQAFWGVPIYSLFTLLNGDWKALLNAVTTNIPAEKFSSKCIAANDPFQLPAGEEKTIEFKLPWHTDQTKCFSERRHLRDVYPCVVLMVLNKTRDATTQPHVVAMVNAIHVSDKILMLYPQLIGQFIKLSSGHTGQIKSIFLSSPATSDDGGDKYDLCLACYHRPVSVVFLPCRHACLCRVCFDLCERCPVCRAASMYFFELPVENGSSEN